MRALDRTAAEALHQRLARRGIQAELLFTAEQRADVIVRSDQVAQAVQELSCRPSGALPDPCVSLTLTEAVPDDLHLEDTTLITAPVPPATTRQGLVSRGWAHLGPFRVHGDDLAAARIWIALLLVMNAGVGLCLIALFVRFRSQRHSAP